MLNYRSAAYALALAVTVSCTSGGTQASEQGSEYCLGDATRQAGELPLRLVACPLTPIVPGSVRLFVGLVNLDSRPRAVSARFELFGSLSIELKDEAGRVLEPRSSWEPQTFSAEFDPYFRWLIPRDGVFGRILNLSCGIEDVEYSADRGDCRPLYDLPAEQSFQVSASLRLVQLCEDTPCEVRPKLLTLTAEPTTIEVPTR